MASQRGNQIAADILLRCNDIDVYIKDATQDTPLHEACRSGHHRIVDQLLSKIKLDDHDTIGIDPQNNESQSPLHLACQEGNVKVVKCIFKHVDDRKTRVALTRTQDSEQNTALHHACASGSEEVVKVLLQNGADVFSKRHENIYPLHIAARHGFIKVAQVLLSSCESVMSVVDIHDKSPLHYAATYNEVDMANFLIDRYKCIYG